MLKKILIKWLILSIAIFLIGMYIEGITILNFLIAMVVAVALTLVNLIIKPIIKIITLPINMMTLGLFTLITNAGLFMLIAYYIPGIEVANFLSALISSFILSIISVILSKF